MTNQPESRPSMFGGMIRRPSLQSCIVALVLLALVPTLGVVAMTLLRSSQSYQDTSSQQLLETANVVAQSVSSELEATSRMLAGYAAMRASGDAGDKAAASADSLVDGKLNFTLVRKERSSLAVAPGADGRVVSDIVMAAASSGNAVVSNIVTSNVDGDASPRIVVAVPGKTEGPDVEIVSLVARPADLIRSLARQGAASGAVVLAITDGTGRVIGRSLDPDRFIGRPVPDWKTLVALGTSNGIFKARTIEGGEIIFAFQKIGGTPGWVAVVGEPLAAFNERWRHPIIVMVLASAVMIFIAFGLAVLLARRILRPIKLLALHARAIAENKGGAQALSVEVPSSFIAEFETLRQSLDAAEAELRRSLEESRQAERAAQQSYQALREAEKLARIGSWTLDLASGHFTCSDMLYIINGADPAGPPLTGDDLSKLLAPESFKRMEAAVARCAETGTPYALEVDHMRKDGTTFAVHVRGQAIRDEAGRIVKLAGTVQDISERKEVVARLAALADNLPSGVIFRLEQPADGERAITYMSAGIEKLIGIPAEDIVKDRTLLLDAIHPQDRAGHDAAMERTLQDAEVFDHEFRMNTRDGRTIWMHTRSASRHQPDGGIVWDGIMRDITGERETAVALRAAKEAAETAEQTKSDFLATMSHEIRTPMNSVVGMTRLTLQTDLSPKQRNYLEKIDASAKVLLGIINDILDFSKIEAGSLKLEGTTFTLESVLESVSAVTAMRAEEKELEINFAVAPDTPRLLKGDPLRLGQVLTNLVGNAIKFTQAGEIVVSIAPVPAERGVTKLQFSVRDTGIGLDAGQIQGLFQPFSQARSDTSRKYGGTGLGLAICKRLVEIMGGKIWVDSVPGQGSTFSFTVAIETVDAVATPKSTTHPSSRLKNRRVLIVDDNASAREVLGDMVSEFGMAAETADSGMQALALLRSEAERGRHFDIVLMDWRMPDMDGLETAKRIRADARLPHMPAVLMVTGYGREEVLRGADQIGLEGVLIKPVTQSVMLNTLQGILSQPDATRRFHDTAAAPTVPSSANPAFNALAGRHVLVVDDNAFNREVVGDFLLLVGVRVETAVNGLEALRLMELHDFDAVLMDMHMPEMDGLTAVREIRRQPRWIDLPVVALTAQARVEDHIASLQAGMTAHLTKPIDEVLLYRTLMDVLGLSEDASTRQPGMQAFTEPAPLSDVDVSLMLERSGRKVGRVKGLLQGFLRDFADAPQRLDQRLGAGDLRQVADLAHQLKGSVGYFGPPDFQAAAGRLENAARRGDSDAVAADAGVFRERLARFLGDIKQALAGLSARGDGPAVPMTMDTILAMVERVAPLVARGDYAAKALLNQIGAGLRGHPGQALVEAVQIHYDDLELDAAGAALSRLKARLEAAEESAHV